MKKKRVIIEIQVADRIDPYFYFDVDTSCFKNMKDVVEAVGFDCFVDDVDSADLPKGIRLIRRTERVDFDLRNRSYAGLRIEPNMRQYLMYTRK